LALVLDWGHDALVSPVNFSWSFNFDGFLFGFDGFQVHHVVNQDLFNEFFLSEVGELIDTHEVSLRGIRVVFVDLHDVFIENLESEGFFLSFVFFIELELEVCEFNLVLIELFDVLGFSFGSIVEDSNGGNDGKSQKEERCFFHEI
jgi:hypothetical protein